MTTTPVPSTTTAQPVVTTTQPPTTTPAPKPKPAPAPDGVLRPGVVPAAGQVGFRGDRAKLKVIDGGGSAPPGTTWNEGALRFGGGDVTLKNVLVKGGVEYSGTGTLTIRDSVIEGNHFSWAPLMAVSGNVDVRDTTITYRDARWPGPEWGNGAIHGDATMTVIRCD
ncbi:MAG: hypothetical protein M3443_16730, partial [Actinomycetota bacterium]|nr:hypothetical protein [Actinomycetota bacterium]